MYRARERLDEQNRRDGRTAPAVSGRAPARKPEGSRDAAVKGRAHPEPLKRKKPPPGNSVPEPMREERRTAAVVPDAPFGDETFTVPRPSAAAAGRSSCKGVLIRTGCDAWRLRAAGNQHRSTRQP